MKKIMSLLLVAVLALSMAACGTTEPTTAPTQEPTSAPTTAPTEEPTAAPTEEPTAAPTEEPTEEPTEAEKKLSMLMMTSGSGMSPDSIMIYDNDMGGLYVEYNIGGIRKIATMDLALLVGLEEAMMNSGMMDLAGTEEYGEGENAVSFYASYSDWSSVSVSYYGVEAPEAFTTAYNTLVAYVETLVADVPEYVPQIQIDTFNGEIDADLLSNLTDICNGSKLPNLDQMMLTNVPVDDNFGFATGLSSSEGITAGASCVNMMMTIPYSLVAVKTSNVDAVVADFEANLNWLKWVCVQPSNALIATNGEMVLCLMGTDEMFTNTVSAIENAGWTVVKTLSNPNM